MVEGEESEGSRMCGRTSVRAAAEAWYWGDGHSVFSIPLNAAIKGDGYIAVTIEEVEDITYLTD